jgi:hypothetical protein
MDIAEFLRQLTEQQNTQSNATSIGNENLNLNAYTRPTLGGNVNAYQETPVGLLSGTIGKEGTNPIYKDVALTNQNFRGGILSQANDTAPYAQYTNPNMMVRAMGGNNPNVQGNYMTDLMGGRASVGGQYDASGLSAMADYQKKLQDDVLLKLYGQINPYDNRIGFEIGKQFK